VYFSGCGPPKHIPEAGVHKGFWAGAPKSRFLAKRCTFGPRNATELWNPALFAKTGPLPDTRACHLKKGPRNYTHYQRFGEVQINISSQGPILLHKVQIPIGIAKCFARFCDFSRFWSREEVDGFEMWFP
jgi:hypothetical protein